MQSLMGIITNTKSEELLKDLTQYRCMSAVPFGGRYRLIDFPLSNMVNSGIRNVGIITSHKYRSLMDHLGSGKEWGLDRKAEGLYYLPSASPSIFKKTLKFDLKDFYNNLDYLEKSRQNYVVVSGTNMVCNVNFKKALQFHKDNACHVTVFYKEEKYQNQDYSHLTFLELESGGRVLEVNRVPNKNESNRVSMEMVILERSLLLDIIKVAAASGNWDLADLLGENMEELRVFAYAHKGYLGKINSIESFYRHNMELLNPDIWQDLFFSNGPIYTKGKDGPPVKYGESAQAGNVMIATGCNIMGKVENSIIFRSVSVHPGAHIKNSIIMQKSEIEENVVLENVILDKEVVVRRGTVLKGEEGHPVVISKKTVI